MKDTGARNRDVRKTTKARRDEEVEALAAMTEGIKEPTKPPKKKSAFPFSTTGDFSTEF